MAFLETFLISIGSSVLFDIIVEALRYVRKSKCKLKVNIGNYSETNIVEETN